MLLIISELLHVTFVLCFILLVYQLLEVSDSTKFAEVSTQLQEQLTVSVPHRKFIRFFFVMMTSPFLTPKMDT